MFGPSVGLFVSNKRFFFENLLIHATFKKYA